MILEDQPNATVLLGDVSTVDLTAQTVTSAQDGRTTVTGYDSLIVSAGAQQSYFGNDHFAEHAPGMKTIDDALELRGRILGAFERAEICSDPHERAKLLTFVVVGAGPTGVEMAGQIAELAHRTLVDVYRNFDTRDARIILLDAAPTVLPPFGLNLGNKAAAALEELGVEIQLGTMVTDVDADGLTVRDSDGEHHRIDAACKVWSAGVAANPLGAQLAAQSGADLDRAGRVTVEDDLTLPGHPNVFVVGDMMAKDRLPGVAQVAIQGGRYAAQQIKTELTAATKDRTTSERAPFRYRDKGSMATIARFKAVTKVGNLELTGVLAWILWLAVHVVYVVGFRSRLATLISWTCTFLGRWRGQLTITDQQITARNAIAQLHLINNGHDDADDPIAKAGADFLGDAFAPETPPSPSPSRGKKRSAGIGGGVTGFVARCRWLGPGVVEIVRLVLALGSAHRCGLEALADEHVSVPTDKGACGQGVRTGGRNGCGRGQHRRHGSAAARSPPHGLRPPVCPVDAGLVPAVVHLRARPPTRRRSHPLPVWLWPNGHSACTTGSPVAGFPIRGLGTSEKRHPSAHRFEGAAAIECHTESSSATPPGRK
jgi:NADH dehydrogenase